MSKSKMRKQEVGKSKPTENRAANSILNEQIHEWVKRVRDAGRIEDGEGIGTSINRVANVLTDLILQTKTGKYPREVISGVVSRVDVQASLRIALESK